MNKFRKKIYQLIAETLGVEEEKVSGSAHFAQDLNAGDLEMEELAETIEKNMQIELDDQEINSIETVDDLVHAVFDKLDGLLEEEEKDERLN